MTAPASKRPRATASSGGRPVRKRDPEKTRARILAAAIAEFSARGYSGARTATIARRAKVNVRMLYHYFGGKDALYITVLEDVLAKLRKEELQLDFQDVAPIEGLVRLFDFIDAHFAQHPELRCLLAFENLNRAQHLRRSTRIPSMASPVLGLIERLLQRGVASGDLRPGIDPLTLYVAMVSLAYYGKSHAHTLSRIFGVDLAAPFWQEAQAEQTRRMLVGFLKA